MQDFNENVIKFLDDISNLEGTEIVESTEYVDKYSGQRLYPLLEKNIYIGLGYHSTQDAQFISPESQFQGNTQLLQADIEQEENFCISNHNQFQPYMENFVALENTIARNNFSDNLIQDLIQDFYEL